MAGKIVLSKKRPTKRSIKKKKIEYVTRTAHADVTRFFTMNEQFLDPGKLDFGFHYAGLSHLAADINWNTSGKLCLNDILKVLLRQPKPEQGQRSRASQFILAMLEVTMLDKDPSFQQQAMLLCDKIDHELQQLPTFATKRSPKRIRSSPRQPRILFRQYLQQLLFARKQTIIVVVSVALSLLLVLRFEFTTMHRILLVGILLLISLALIAYRIVRMQWLIIPEPSVVQATTTLPSRKQKTASIRKQATRGESDSNLPLFTTRSHRQARTTSKKAVILVIPEAAETQELGTPLAQYNEQIEQFNGKNDVLQDTAKTAFPQREEKMPMVSLVTELSSGTPTSIVDEEPQNHLYLPQKVEHNEKSIIFHQEEPVIGRQQTIDEDFAITPDKHESKDLFSATDKPESKNLTIASDKRDDEERGAPTEIIPTDEHPSQSPSPIDALPERKMKPISINDSSLSENHNDEKKQAVQQPMLLTNETEKALHRILCSFFAYPQSVGIRTAIRQFVRLGPDAPGLTPEQRRMLMGAIPLFNILDPSYRLQYVIELAQEEDSLQSLPLQQFIWDIWEVPWITIHSDSETAMQNELRTHLEKIWSFTTDSIAEIPVNHEP